MDEELDLKQQDDVDEIAAMLNSCTASEWIRENVRPYYPPGVDYAELRRENLRRHRKAGLN